jgi:hypothetical protein
MSKPVSVPDGWHEASFIWLYFKERYEAFVQQILVYLHLRLTCLPVILFFLFFSFYPFLFRLSIYLFIYSFLLS